MRSSAVKCYILLVNEFILDKFLKSIGFYRAFNSLKNGRENRRKK